MPRPVTNKSNHWKPEMLGALEAAASKVLGWASYWRYFDKDDLVCVGWYGQARYEPRVCYRNYERVMAQYCKREKPHAERRRNAEVMYCLLRGRG